MRNRWEGKLMRGLRAARTSRACVAYRSVPFVHWACLFTLLLHGSGMALGWDGGGGDEDG